MRNVPILLIYGYRGPTLKSHYDVIYDVITMKILFNGIIDDALSISAVNVKLYGIFRRIQNGRHLDHATKFYPVSGTRS